MKDSSFGLIPIDYHVKTLSELGTKITDKVEDRNLNVLSAVSSGNLVLSEEYFDKQVYSEKINKYIIVKKENFAYNPARINIGSIGMNEFDFDGCVSPVYVVYQAKPLYKYFLKMFFKTRTFNNQVNLRASGSVRQTLNFKDFSMIELICPTPEKISKFNQLYKSYNKIINHNKKQIENLTKIRNTLLPKLMSGEIDVSDVEI